MKYYRIYQYFVPPDHNSGKDILVGKSTGITADLAKENYLKEEYPGDDSKRNFIKGYLTVRECSARAFKKNDSEIIKNNKRDLGVWA